MGFSLTGCWVVAAGIHHDQMVPILGASSFFFSPFPSRPPTPPNRQTPILPARTAIQIEDGLMCWQPGQGPNTFFGWGDPLGETEDAGVESTCLFLSFLSLSLLSLHLLRTISQTGCEEQQFR